MITPDQCRAARALIRMSAADLAVRAEVSLVTVKRFESDQPVAYATLGAIRTALMNAGIAFIASGERSLEGDEGVRVVPIPPER